MPTTVMQHPGSTDVSRKNSGSIESSVSAAKWNCCGVAEPGDCFQRRTIGCTSMWPPLLMVILTGDRAMPHCAIARNFGDPWTALKIGSILIFAAASRVRRAPIDLAAGPVAVPGRGQTAAPSTRRAGFNYGAKLLDHATGNFMAFGARTAKAASVAEARPLQSLTTKRRLFAFFWLFATSIGHY